MAGAPPPDWATPVVTPVNREWFTSGTLAIQRCAACAAVQHPPEEVCHRCGGTEFHYRAVAPRGTVYSFVVVHYAANPALAESVPYAVALVSLDELPEVRVVGNIPSVDPAELYIGMPVAAFWDERGRSPSPAMEAGVSGPLSGIRICDFTGQLAGAGATRFLAAFGAEIIRIEDPLREGRWDILRGAPPFKDERRGVEFGTGFQNHNVNKLGVTLNLRTERGRELLRGLVRVSDVVTENFAAGVLERLGFGYEALVALQPNIIYVSNSGFGHTGPYRQFKTWGPIVQAVSGLTFTSGLPDQPPAGWGYSYMDHTGAYIMAIAILAALRHRQRTGEGQWVDLACTEAGATLHGPALLDWSVNGRPARRRGRPDSNHGDTPRMVPHNIYPAAGDDCWVAISCRDDRDWPALARVTGFDCAADPDLASVAGRAAREAELDAAITAWTQPLDPFDAAARLLGAGVPAAAVTRPSERIDQDPNVAAWGLWPEVNHPAIGRVRVDGLPVHLSETDWEIDAPAPLLGQHNDLVYGDILGLGQPEIDALRDQGVI